MTKQQADIKIIPGDTRILLIAPHGKATKPRDDINTDKITLAAAATLKCCAIVNDVFKRDQYDFNTAQGAAAHSKFLGAIKDVVDTDGHTLVVWIHGAKDTAVRAQARKKDSGFTGKPEALHALIGYGQGANPRDPQNDAQSRFTATQTMAETFRDLLTQKGMTAIFTPEGSGNFRGRDPRRMNQWFLNEGYAFDQVESIQLEIKRTGFRNTDDIANTAKIIADALTELVPIRQASEKAVAEPAARESVVAEVLDETAQTPFDQSGNPQPGDANAEASSLPVPAGRRRHESQPVGTDEQIAEQAYQWLMARYRERVASFFLEVGDYLINIFYGGNAILAYAKNKSREQPRSLRLLIRKFQSASPQESGPSETWFYRAVGLAAQMSIAKERGLSSMTILGHTHQIKILNYPKLKEIKGDEFAAAIDSAFQVKEQLAQVAVEKNLTTREFGMYIKSQQDQLNLAKLPPKNELLKKDADELLRLYDLVQVKIDRNQKAVVGYGKAQYRLKVAIAELTGEVKGEGKFQDWTKSKNNFNICTGCQNDCLYCYMKPIYDGKPGRKQPRDWANFDLRQKNVDEKRGLCDGLVGFPSSHDIFPEILDAYLEVLGKFLRAGNEVLIVSKPRLDCIKAICDASTFFKDKILFRFTIGAMDPAILSFWEPNAPAYEHRKECLAHAKERGFQTSVSIEPMLDSPNIEALVADLDPLVSQDIWLGMMSHLNKMRNWSNAEGFDNRKEAIEIGQTPPVLAAIYHTYRDNPKIKWKTETLKVIIEHLKSTGAAL